MAYKRISPMPVDEGGTAQITLTTAYGVLCAGTTATGPVQTLSALGAAGTVLTSNGAAALPSFQVSGGSGVTSITGTVNQISVDVPTGAVTLSIPSTFIAPGSIASTTSLTAGNLSTAGIVYNAVTTGLLSTHATTNHNVQVGNSSGQLGDIAPSATSGIPLISQGASADPIFGTAVVAGGGTGDTSFTAYAVITGGTTSTGALQNVVGVGTLNQVLVSQGAGALPIWAAVPATSGVTSIAGTANQISASASTGAVTLSTPSTFIAPGSISATTVHTTTTGTTSTAGQYQINGSRILHAFGTRNTFVGSLAGNFTLTTGSAVANTSLGAGGNFSALTSGQANTAIGDTTLNTLTSGSFNTAVGQNSGSTLLTGQRCVFIGTGTAASYTGAESSNILIGMNVAGTVGESNKLRIGSATGSSNDQLNAAFICGIYNTAVGATAGVVLADSTNQIGGLAGAAGTVLVGGTKPAFSALSGLAVTSITGTANQITASASTGAVTLSIPSTFIAPGSIEATTSVKADTVFNTPTTTSTVGQYQINGAAVMHTFGTGLGNTFLGLGAGNFTLGASEHNTAIGSLAGASLNAASGHNTYVGYQAGTLDDGAGGSATAVGHNSYSAFTGATVARNTCLGADSLLLLTAGRRNVALGYSAGSALTTNDSDNIFIGPNVTGTAGNNNHLIIGSGTGTGDSQINRAFICGINGITVTGTAVLISSSDQLGIAVSSKRFKENIADLGDTNVLNLRPVSFNYIIGDDRTLQTGLIAEEVHDLMPHLVVMDKEGLPQTVKYHDLPVLLLVEMKKMAQRIQSLEELVYATK